MLRVLCAAFFAGLWLAGCGNSLGQQAIESPSPDTSTFSANEPPPAPRIFFQKNSADIPAEGHKVVAGIAQWISDHPGEYGISIAGHASNDEGDEDQTRRLSLERAEAVAAVMAIRLASLGITMPSELLTVEAFGQRYPVDVRDRLEAKALNRNVTIQILNTE